MRTSTVTPPVAVVLSENTMQLVLFPFRENAEMLINAVLLPECSIWGTSSILEKVIFGILMCIVDSSVFDRAEAVEYTFPDKLVKRVIEKRVVTEKEELEKVQEERDTLKQTLKQMNTLKQTLKQKTIDDEKQMKETEKQMKETEKQMKETEKQMNEMREELHRKNSSTKIPRVVCLSHPCTLRHSSEGRQIRPAELGKQPEF